MIGSQSLIKADYAQNVRGQDKLGLDAVPDRGTGEGRNLCP